jgi:hypothetical protein
MLTSAGVSALDGNKFGAGGGLVHTFREAIAEHYGGYDNLFTGWISLYCYEPSVGQRILRDLVDAEPNITLLTESDVVGYERPSPGVRRALVQLPDGTRQPYDAAVFIDASEYGDGMKLAGLPYRLGRESRDELGESAAPEVADLELQDLTYAATLVKRPGAAPLPATAQDRAYWSKFECSTLVDCADPDEDRLGHTIHDFESFITYAMLPNDKVLLNWPHHSNDYPINVAFFEDRYYRARHLASAKLHTVQYIKYMHHVLGHPEWQIAEDEYPSADHLPLIPYMRESRRLVNDDMLVMTDLTPVTPAAGRAKYQPDSIAVGDYFLDHHHSKHHLPPEQRLKEDFPSSAPFQIPSKVFFNEQDERFIAAEKSIAVSHIVNGSTRLQPPVMLMGQAAGAFAARSASSGAPARSIATSDVQDDLIEAGAPLMIMYDISPDDALFGPAQRLVKAGVLREDTSTYFDAEEPLTAGKARAWTERAGMTGIIDGDLADDAPIQRTHVSGDLRAMLPRVRREAPIQRGMMVRVLDDMLNTRA